MRLLGCSLASSCSNPPLSPIPPSSPFTHTFFLLLFTILPHKFMAQCSAPSIFVCHPSMTSSGSCSCAVSAGCGCCGCCGCCRGGGGRVTGSESASSMKREPHVGHCAWNEQRTVRHTLHTKPRVMSRRWQKQIAAVAPRSASRPSCAPSPGSRSSARHRLPVWQQHCPTPASEPTTTAKKRERRHDIIDNEKRNKGGDGKRQTRSVSRSAAGVAVL